MSVNIIHITHIVHIYTHHIISINKYTNNNANMNDSTRLRGREGRERDEMREDRREKRNADHAILQKAIDWRMDILWTNQSDQTLDHLRIEGKERVKK